MSSDGNHVSSTLPKWSYGDVLAICGSAENSTVPLKDIWSLVENEKVCIIHTCTALLTIVCSDNDSPDTRWRPSCSSVPAQGTLRIG